MKEIILLDTLAPIGHKDINEFYIDKLKDSFNLTYMSRVDYPSKQLCDKYRRLDIKEKYYKGQSPLKKRLGYLLTLFSIKANSKRKIDTMIFLSYDIISFGVFSLLNRRFISNHKIYLFNHNNIDELINSKIKRFFLKLIPKDVSFLCYEDFITEYLKNNLNRNAITLRHNLNHYKLEYKQNNINPEVKKFFNDDAIYIVALSGNDISGAVINSIKELDKSNVLMNKNIKIFIKNKKLVYNSDYVYVCNDYMSDNDYSYALSHCNYILLPYDVDEFKYRVSGLFFDSLTFKKPVIATKTLFMEHLIQKFGIFGYFYDKDESFNTLIKNITIDAQTLYQSVIDKMFEYYSDERVKNDIISIVL